MPDVADLTVYDDDESDIIAWPSDRRGRVINWRMTPDYAAALAADLEEMSMPSRSPWQDAADGLREAARRSAGLSDTGRRGLGRLPEPLPRVRVAPTLPPDRTRDPSRGARP
jgi:hypothetical protein